MTELSQTERMALRRIINLLPAIEKQFGIGEYLDDDKIIKYAQPQSAPVPKLVDACDSLFKFYNKYPRVCYDGESDLLGAIRTALTAEKRRQELVDEILKQWRNKCDWKLEAALQALDAFDDQGRRDNDKERG